MAKSARDLCDKSCQTCEKQLDCMNSIRNSIGDLAEAFAHTLKNIQGIENVIKNLTELIKKQFLIEDEHSVVEGYYI